nr:hypothetical protein B0A51_16993 [Rachicladosporium sp. CCFEE 5018]
MSRFVSTGTTDDAPSTRDEAWLKAQAEIEAKHVAQQVAARSGAGREEKSLYETLQANKAAKQDAFEESMRLKNQFRSLDEDEVEFLENLTASERAEARRVKEETRAQLEAYKVQREEAEKAAAAAAGDGEGPQVVGVESWAVAGSKKRKKGQREGIGGVKVRRTSTLKEVKSLKTSVEPPAAGRAQEAPAISPVPNAAPTSKAVAETAEVPPMLSSPSPPAAALGLAGYSSDEDDSK